MDLIDAIVEHGGMINVSVIILAIKLFEMSFVLYFHLLISKKMYCHQPFRRNMVPLPFMETGSSVVFMGDEITVLILMSMGTGGHTQVHKIWWS